MIGVWADLFEAKAICQERGYGLGRLAESLDDLSEKAIVSTSSGVSGMVFHHV